MTEQKSIKPNILYVDDLQPNRLLFQVTFKKEYHIILAESASKALEILKHEDIQVLVTDQRMPDMTGTELLEIVAREYPEIRRYLLTAYTDFESVVEAVNKGRIHGYINKPIQAEEVIKSINNSLEVHYLRKKNRQIMADLERANEELSNLDNVKTGILKIMSNEIRIPLNRIMGTVHLLKDKIESEELTHLINILDSSVSRLEQFSLMAEQISSLKSGERKLNLEKISLKQLLEYSLVETGELLSEKNIGVDLQQKDDLEINGDFELLISCLVNIINHTIRHTDPNEKITIRTRRTNDQTICEIIDTGKNYSEKRLGDLISHFSKRSSEMDLKFGIELALAQLIMESHEGTLGFSVTDNKAGLSRLVFSGIPEKES
jgi:signal transduction histidine kinase